MPAREQDLLYLHLWVSLDWVTAKQFYNQSNCLSPTHPWPLSQIIVHFPLLLSSLRLERATSPAAGATHDGDPPGLVWDLTNGVKYACWKSNAYSGTLPCLLRKHRLWHVGQARPILGRELLSGHGFDAAGLAQEGVVKGDQVYVPVALPEFPIFFLQSQSQSCRLPNVRCKCRLTVGSWRLSVSQTTVYRNLHFL